MKKRDAWISLVLLSIGIWVIAFNIQQAKALEPPATEWSRTYGGTERDRPECVIQTIDGGYALAGSTETWGAGRHDCWLVKTDARGDPLWNQTYGDTENDYGKVVIQTDDGGYAIAATTYSRGKGKSDLWLIKTDADGVHLWNETCGDTGDDNALCVIQTSDGGYALAGHTTSYGAGGEDFWLVKTDSAGTMQWNAPYGEPDNDENAWCGIQTSDGGYAIAGWAESSPEDGWLIKLAGPPVGGVWVPTNKTALLGPIIGLASLIAIAAVSVVYVKCRKKQQN